jgi:hypothetical protein
MYVYLLILREVSRLGRLSYIAEATTDRDRGRQGNMCEGTKKTHTLDDI